MWIQICGGRRRAVLVVVIIIIRSPHQQHKSHDHLVYYIYMTVDLYSSSASQESKPTREACRVQKHSATSNT